MNQAATRIEQTAADTRLNAQGAQVPAGRAVVSVAHDADEQARNLVGWRQTYDQLAAGRFVGTLTEIPLDTMKIFCETTSQTLRQACEVRGDAYWFGIPAALDGQARIDSQPFGEHAIAVRPGNVEFELLTPAQFSIYGVVVRGDVLRHYAETVERVPLDARLPSAPTVRAGAARLAQLCALLAQRLGDTDADDDMLSDVERDDAQAELLAALFDACTARDDEAGNTDGLADPPSRRRWIVAQARDYVLAHRSRPVGVPELCEQLHVSRRTLQYCFQDVLGMAPATYLRALRLNGARRDLCGRAAGSVQDVAAAWGFWHLSQFATDYRRMFGMRPSEALRAA
ncbi:AraC family transcriptional regulator [Paraburkholderia eburnea]|uniref:AraC family transcriptional regulator n=1 Tax=Paraburkholderia eburnea TaxID=1189126 RepID=A0A2S4M694_9BURK|nr:helix-turn-helix domain-containing protein [Paraburkholderia eburnea]POR50228.1 AraC family transcriptional regulator [Paraburkholderia eburnea]PRZ20491.1 AraC family transcriptional regulator [Paraburkholderia eburnea]